MRTSNKKILYVMHVSWHWIKQRPQFLAENLSQYFEVKILYKKSILELFTESNSPNNCIGIIQLPLSRFKLIQKLNMLIYRLYINKYLKQVDYLWMSSAFDYSNISDLVDNKVKLVYDCMDDVCEFPHNKKDQNIAAITEKERRLVERANNVIVSSNWLKTVISNRYALESNITVVNNALDHNFLNKNIFKKEINYPKKNNHTDIMYIGTISEWFNFDLITNILKKTSNLRLILIGPLAVDIPKHNRIIHLGSKNHSDLPLYMSKTDALVMPFVINDLVLSVNPVKLYEYIFSGKPVISCNYEEINQFNEFVYTYDDENDFFKLINDLTLGKLLVNSKKEREDFLYKNTWAERSSEISKIILE